MENMAMYNRLLKYGHIQTDPLEVDTSSGGDSNGGILYHPALAPEDRPHLAAHTLVTISGFTAGYDDLSAPVQVNVGLLTLVGR